MLLELSCLSLSSSGRHPALVIPILTLRPHLRLLPRHLTLDDNQQELRPPSLIYQGYKNTYRMIQTKTRLNSVRALYFVLHLLFVRKTVQLRPIWMFKTNVPIDAGCWIGNMKNNITIFFMPILLQEKCF